MLNGYPYTTAVEKILIIWAIVPGELHGSPGFHLVRRGRWSFFEARGI